MEAIDRLDKDGARLLFKRASVCTTLADQFEAENADGLTGDGETGTLSGTHESGTLDAMEVARVRSRAASLSVANTNPETRTVFQAILQEHNMSLPQWAAKHPELNVNTAKSWVKSGNGGRPIPAKWAGILAREFKRPELRLPESWPHGIRSGRRKTKN
jgi:hypothetical protein